MCNIWQKKLDTQMSPDEIRKVFSNAVFREVQYIGLNGGEPTLRRDIGDIVDSLICALPKLRGISLITNAIVYDKVTQAIAAISDRCKGTEVRLDVMVSLDGIGEVHDKVRGRKGNFESATRVLSFLAETDYANTFRIGCTIISDNVFDVENVLNWCIEKSIYARFRVGIPHRRLYSLDFPHPTGLSHSQLYHLATFLDHLYYHYEQDELRRLFYRSLRDQLVYGKKRNAGCAWKSHGVTVGPRGEFAFCAVESNSLGNATTEDAEKLFWQNGEHLKQIQQTKCSNCLHDYEGKMISETLSGLFAKAVNNKASHILARGNSLLPYRVRTRTKATVVAISEARREKRLLNLQRKIVCASKLPPNVLLCGWYGTETLGDKAILASVGACVKGVGIEKVDLASLEPYVSNYTVSQMPEAGIASVIDIKSALERLNAGQYRAVIMAGGPLMSAVREVADMSSLFEAARQRGAEAIIAGCGIGPLGVPHGDQAIKAILQLSTQMFFRDKKSATLAQQLAGLDSLPRHSGDPALVWLRRFRESRPPASNQILLALREWPIHEYAQSMNWKSAEGTKNRFESELQKMVLHIQSKAPDIKIVPFCMHKRSVGGDDRMFYRRLFAKFPSVIANLDQLHRTPEADVNQFLCSTQVLAMRYHSVVFSLMLGCGFRAVDYTMGGKTAALLDTLNASSLCETLSDFDGEKVADVLLRKEQLDSKTDRLVQELTDKVENDMKSIFAIISK